MSVLMEFQVFGYEKCDLDITLKQRQEPSVC